MDVSNHEFASDYVDGEAAAADEEYQSSLHLIALVNRYVNLGGSVELSLTETKGLKRMARDCVRLGDPYAISDQALIDLALLNLTQQFWTELYEYRIGRGGTHELKRREAVALGRTATRLAKTELLSRTMPRFRPKSD